MQDLHKLCSLPALISIFVLAKTKCMLMRAATVVQVLHGLFYVLLQLLVVAAIYSLYVLSFIVSFILVVIHP